MYSQRLLISVASALFAGTLSFSTAASPQTGTDQHKPVAPQNNDIIVEAGQPDALRRYVEQMAATPPGKQLARWNTPLCIRIAGFKHEFSSFLEHRIKELATHLRVRIAEKGCVSGALIKLTDDADQLIDSLLQSASSPIKRSAAEGPRDPQEIRALRAPHVVRWLTASETVNADGRPIGVPNRTYSASLISSGVREDIHLKLVIIDAQRLSAVTMNQLADYVAFVVFGAPRLGENFSDVDSIMALFATGTERRAGLTDQDHSFLEALYITPPDRSARTQKRSIQATIRK